jgi:hypothetical protein
MTKNHTISMSSELGKKACGAMCVHNHVRELKADQNAQG